MCFLSAEIAQSHDGSLGIAHSYIDALKDVGVDAIKFQMHIAEAESSIHEPFRTKFSYEDDSRYDYWKRMEFSYEQWEGLKKHCDDLNIEFIASPFSIKASSWLRKLKVKKVKIGSGEINNKLLIDHVSGYVDEIILSSGLCSEDELQDIIDYSLKKFKKISLLQCTSEYPCSPENWGLDYISYFKEKFKNIKIGYSDHSGTITSSIAAAALKAEIIEFHVTFDKKMFGPDNLSSLTINEVKKLCAAVRQIKASVNSGFNKFSESNTSEIKNIFSKSLTVNNNFKRNHTIVSEDLETAKPGMMGISPKDYKNILGKKLKRDMEKGDFLNYDDLI